MPYLGEAIIPLAPDAEDAADARHWVDSIDA
jgi:hypothetical protein